jgi:integrase/recombinase XerD
MNKEVNLTKRVLTDAGLRYCPVVLSSNGRVKQDYVYIDGKPSQHPEGNYYIEWREGNRRRRLSVGSDASEAHTQRLRKEAELNARNHGVDVTPEANGRRTLFSAIADYKTDIAVKKPKTIAAYTTALDYFAQSCKKTFLDEMSRGDMLAYIVFLRNIKRQSPRSQHNKFGHIMTFLKASGIRGLVKKNDWPAFTEEEPEIYEREELDTLFAVCDDEERLWFEFFLMTGMREQETMYCYWRDINFAGSTVRVTHKPDRGWTPKAYKEREIPIPDKLVASLRARKAKSDKKCNLVFPTAGCKPKLDFLDCLKAVAKRAKLKPEDFWLHKFRATFATWSLWAGVDLRTVQQWLGHSDMESTMRYLKPSRSKETRAKVNAIFA